MTAGERRAVRLAWAIGLCSLALVLVSLVLLVLDLAAIDSPLTAQALYFVSASIAAVLGLPITTRQPRNPIGWLLLASALGEAIYMLAGFIAMRGLLRLDALGGIIEIDSTPGSGTTLRASIPIARTAPDAGVEAAVVPTSQAAGAPA